MLQTAPRTSEVTEHTVDQPLWPPLTTGTRLKHMRSALTLLIGAVVACGLAGAASSTSRDVWAQLHRPLHIPHIAPGSPCPASPPDTTVDFRSYGVGQGYGPGPAYPIFLNRPDHAQLDFNYPSAGIFAGDPGAARRCSGSFARVTEIESLCAGGSSTGGTASALGRNRVLTCPTR